VIGLSTYGGQAALPGGSLYHASKWGLEGFLDALGQELAPLNIGVTIIEPGGARTNFRFGGAQLGTPMDAYKGTPAAMVHTMMKDTSRLPPGDPAKMAKVMIESVEQNPAPKRIALGSDAYGMIHKALADRLSALEAQRETAFSTDFPK
jgi:NAD(P)-dependent dehydrogenase (short-subunit alcohol dehydrogenase family)